jgi:type IV pilus assembly protein PilE
MNQIKILPVSKILKRHSGVTLIELMIVVVVLSILVALAYPSYQTQMTENRRTDGQRILLEIMNEQQKFYLRNSRYTADLVAGGTVGLDYPDPNGDGSVPSDKEFYLVTAQACPTFTINDCVELTAVPQGGQADDGNMTYNSRNQKAPATHW